VVPISIETAQELAQSVKAIAVPPPNFNRVPAPGLVIADAKANTAIINNVISGEVRIYGTTGAQTAAEFFARATLFRSANTTITSAHTLRIEGNILTALLVDKNIKGSIIPPTPSSAASSATGLFERMSILDNDFSALGSQWLARHIISSGNHFKTIASATLLLATAAGGSFICVGTSCLLPVQSQPAQIRRAVPQPNFRESANLITFVP
jgi:hypothetical protein